MLDREFTGLAVAQKMIQCQLNHRKCQLRPGDVSFIEQSYLRRFIAGAKDRLCEMGAVKHIDLIDLGYIEQCVELWVNDLRIGFFSTFPESAIK